MTNAMSPVDHLLSPLRGLAAAVAGALADAPLNLLQATRLANNAGALSFQKLALQDEYGIQDNGDEFVISGWPDDHAAELLDDWRRDAWWKS